MQFLVQSLIDYAVTFMGTPYIYGGDNPLSGLDCSGFVQELLEASGELPFGTPKMNCQMLYNHYAKLDKSPGGGPGALAFFGKDARSVVHIGFCVNATTMLEAGGGDKTTLTIQDAIKRRAFLKMRPIRYRRDFLCCITPTYSAYS